jgi:hypothetical protein
LTSEDVIISVGKQMDDKVQKSHKEEFQRATLFVVAHRLGVILDGDLGGCVEEGKDWCCSREGLYGVVSGDSLEAHGLCHHGIKVSAFTSWNKIWLQNAMRLSISVRYHKIGPRKAFQRSLILGMRQMFHSPPMRAPPLADISG